LTSGALLAQASGSLRCSEQRLWHSLLSCLRPADILLGDRAYGASMWWRRCSKAWEWT